MPTLSHRAEELAPIASTWFRRLGPPVILFLCARARLWRSALHADADPSDPHAWARWDSGHYFSIAQQGYEFMSCRTVPGYDPAQFCGNTAWLPGYPLLMRALISLGFEPDVAGTLIAASFAVATLILIWNAFLDAEISLASLLTLTLAAFFPGHVYYHGVFPVSLCAFLLALALAAYMKRRFAWAGVAAGCAAFTYSSGAFVAAVFGLHLLAVERHRPWKQQIRQWILTSGLTALGFIAFLALLHFAVGTWKAYFLVQAKYNYDPTWPWLAILEHGLDMQTVGSKFANVQTVYVAILATLLLVAAARPERKPMDGAFALFVLVYWWVPLALGGSLSLYRAESMLLPAVPLARKLPVPVLCILAGLAIFISAKMGVLYFRNTLV